MKEQIWTPTEIGLAPTDCADGEHQWEAESHGTLNTSSKPAVNWRCKKCLCTRTTYD